MSALKIPSMALMALSVAISSCVLGASMVAMMRPLVLSSRAISRVDDGVERRDSVSRVLCHFSEWALMMMLEIFMIVLWS